MSSSILELQSSQIPRQWVFWVWRLIDYNPGSGLFSYYSSTGSVTSHWGRSFCLLYSSPPEPSLLFQNMMNHHQCLVLSLPPPLQLSLRACRCGRVTPGPLTYDCFLFSGCHRNSALNNKFPFQTVSSHCSSTHKGWQDGTLLYPRSTVPEDSLFQPRPQTACKAVKDCDFVLLVGLLISSPLPGLPVG